jgi:ATP-dependent DNA helicase RecQ
MPSYIVFSDAVLKDLVKHKPRDKKSMLKIKGIKDAKFEKYGEQFLTRIKEYL